MLEISLPEDFSRNLECSLHCPDVSLAQLEKLCSEARAHHFVSVGINGSWVVATRHLLEDSEVKVSCAVGFPLGATASDVKRFETETAVDDGAQEIDVVLNIARLKAGEDKYVLRELIDVTEAADERAVKVIMETCLLSNEEKVRACQIVVESGAHFVKTSTSFNGAATTIGDVQLMRKTVGQKFGVVATLGAFDPQTALAMFTAGATRVNFNLTSRKVF